MLRLSPGHDGPSTLSCASYIWEADSSDWCTPTSSVAIGEGVSVTVGVVVGVLSHTRVEVGVVVHVAALGCTKAQGTIHDVSVAVGVLVGVAVDVLVDVAVESVAIPPLIDGMNSFSSPCPKATAYAPSNMTTAKGMM